jgi:hypothetical protein
MLSGLTRCIAQVRLPFPSFSPPFVILAAATPSNVHRRPLQCAHGRAAMRPPRLDGARLLPSLSRSRSSCLRILPPSLRRDLAAWCLGLLLLPGGRQLRPRPCAIHRRADEPRHELREPDRGSCELRFTPRRKLCEPGRGAASSALCAAARGRRRGRRPLRGAAVAGRRPQHGGAVSGRSPGAELRTLLCAPSQPPSSM